MYCAERQGVPAGAAPQPHQPLLAQGPPGQHLPHALRQHALAPRGARLLSQTKFMSDTCGRRQAVYRAAFGPGQGTTRPFAAHSAALLARREAWRERLKTTSHLPLKIPHLVSCIKMKGCFRQAATCDCTAWEHGCPFPRLESCSQTWEQGTSTAHLVHDTACTSSIMHTPGDKGLRQSLCGGS